MCFTRNIKGISLRGKEKTITRHKKISEQKNPTGRGKHIEKVVDQYL